MTELHFTQVCYRQVYRRSSYCIVEFGCVWTTKTAAFVHAGFGFFDYLGYFIGEAAESTRVANPLQTVSTSHVIYFTGMRQLED